MTTDLDLTNYQGLVLYAVQRRDGKWFHHKPSTSHYGYSRPDPDSGWVDDLTGAKTWKSTQGARLVIGWFAENFPQIGIPNLVKFTMSTVEVIDESARIEKARQAKIKRQETAEVREKQRALECAEAELRRKQQELEAARVRYERLHGGT